MDPKEGSRQMVSEAAQSLDVPTNRLDVFEAIVYEAATLFGDGDGGELGGNAEYERGIAELTCQICELPAGFDGKEDVIALIHSLARVWGEGGSLPLPWSAPQELEG